MFTSKIAALYAVLLLVISTSPVFAEPIRIGYASSQFISDLVQNTAFFGTPIAIVEQNCHSQDDQRQNCTYVTGQKLEITTLSDHKTTDIDRILIALPPDILPVIVLNTFASMASAVGPDFTGDELQLLWTEIYYEASELRLEGKSASRTLHGLKFTIKVSDKNETFFSVSR
ncbi:hypothetical protein [Maritalea sp.]|uniref:hypothetical protein n=1 Tax=Maritalea sp. TaxID=2003361 RepID=UPI003EF4D163